jgi:hypothetical protein
VRYLAAGGYCDVFDIDAHLEGVLSLPLEEQDTLAFALNERLDECLRASYVPYLVSVEPTSQSLEEVIAELLSEGLNPAVQVETPAIQVEPPPNAPPS